MRLPVPLVRWAVERADGSAPSSAVVKVDTRDDGGLFSFAFKPGCT
eukprot:CAMPEP_0171881448 /NCGR_PEP_ID=MMETSP0992-20121227/39017_1 /TAXON_ID=483369 /ORGANISM="non described non described, Strain CCMP2098" /LENGTH=45 /DNA_ID= /DNA_START= /DNA_END= /DNA_ORIENTATION=